jgi:hypothetical protein
MNLNRFDSNLLNILSIIPYFILIYAYDSNVPNLKDKAFPNNLKIKLDREKKFIQV